MDTKYEIKQMPILPVQRKYLKKIFDAKELLNNI